MLGFVGVSGARGGRSLFADLSFALGPGDAALVTGPNGAGKSTLVRIAAGLVATAAGHVEREGSLALLTEAHALDLDRRLGEALVFWTGRRRLPAALAAMGLEALADAPVRILSTGQRRRAGIARVVASGAPIWLLDEPANGLDAAGVALLEAQLAAHRAAGGATLVTTHLPLALPGAQDIAL